MGRGGVSRMRVHRGGADHTEALLSWHSHEPPHRPQEGAS
ncbi:MAG: hypothetical protein AVDCRST_MAG08-3057 [uncultured Acetobacteraceae bacterium]|uniref:Uncharacterized protein n=1 Tax=uncultured Acetobacteraceae bacterium TaxID=169975 RepID=A0A6J4J4S2_9PROT|nr:MAG: hypothetical protein AVDCRST_MAG08-3057 [uncultured Acetobacteraceae bacterium]